MPRSPEVEFAISSVPMWAACRLVGMNIPRGLAGGSKQYCPFGDLWHPDGGYERAFRVYLDHGFCFACWKWWSPPGLCADAWDVTLDVAAARLLDETGLRPPDYLERYDAAAAVPPADHSVLAEALRTWCRGESGSDWEVLRMNPAVGSYLGACLGYLGQVVTEEQAEQWLSLAQQIMRPVLSAGRRNHGSVAGCPVPGGMEAGI